MPKKAPWGDAKKTMLSLIFMHVLFSRGGVLSVSRLQGDRHAKCKPSKGLSRSYMEKTVYFCRRVSGCEVTCSVFLIFRAPRTRVANPFSEPPDNSYYLVKGVEVHPLS